MSRPEKKRYSISEVSEMTGLAQHTLRQWEDNIPLLKPQRDRQNRRWYTDADLRVVRRVIQLKRHEKLTMEGINRRLRQEMLEQGQPMTKQEAINLIDKIEADARYLLDLLDREPSSRTS